MSDDNRPSPAAEGRRWRLAGAIVLVALLALLLLRGRQDETSDTVAIAPPSTGFNGSPSPFARSSSPLAGVSEPGPAAATDPAAAADAAPEGVAPEQWQRVLEALADHPQRETELQRLAAFMQYASRLETFRAQRQAGVADDQLRPLARELNAGLDERVERGEVTPEEAIMIRTALLESLATPGADSR
jgi:hypothetical protein